MVFFRDYEIYLLFLLLVKFHGSGKCEIYSPVQRILQCFLSCASLSLETVNADPSFLNVTFVKIISVLQSGFQQFFFISNLRYDVGISITYVINEVWITMMRYKSRAKDLIFKCNNIIRSEFDINYETERCTIFLISLSLSSCFARWLSITNMMAMQTQERVAICT